jgi:hypothetical protein
MATKKKDAPALTEELTAVAAKIRKHVEKIEKSGQPRKVKRQGQRVRRRVGHQELKQVRAKHELASKRRKVTDD